MHKKSIVVLSMQEIPSRQARLFGRVKVYASRGVETHGEHADALGADPRLPSAIPHHRSHHLRQRNPMGHRTSLSRTMGLHVDHDEEREEGQKTFQEVRFGY